MPPGLGRGELGGADPGHLLPRTCPPGGGASPRWKGSGQVAAQGVCREEEAGARLTETMETRQGPLNEDVFSAPPGLEEKAPQPGVQELTEQIHRLLLQVGAVPPAP